MTINQKVGVAVGIGLVVGVTIIVMKQSLKKKGWTHNKFLSKAFNVPLVDKKYVDLQEQEENIATKDGIEFR